MGAKFAGPTDSPHLATTSQRDRILPVTEREFMRQMLDLAALFLWPTYHAALSKWSERGWPDPALVRLPRLVFAELERESARTTPRHDRWLALLGVCPGCEVYLRRPSDFERITEVLR
jgi:hypothetical protein